MRHHHALRPACRSGRVDHIGWIVGAGLQRNVRLPLHRASACEDFVDVEKRVCAGNTRVRSAVPEQQRQARIARHEREAFGRKRWIERNVGRATLQDTEQSDQHAW